MEKWLIPIVSSLMIDGGEGFTILFDGMVFSPRMGLTTLSTL
jgi:hypothetical protein